MQIFLRVGNIPQPINGRDENIADFSANERVRRGTPLAQCTAEESMKVHAFFHRHYSAAAGESPAGHAMAIAAGAVMIVIGGYLMLSLLFLPLGAVIGILGVFVLVEGAIAHIQRPVTLSDACEAAIGLAGGAIAVTFALSVLVLVIVFGAGTFAALIDWLRG